MRIMNHPKLSQNIKSGIAATAPYIVLSLDTNICVSRKRYCMAVKTGPENRAAFSALL